MNMYLSAPVSARQEMSTVLLLKATLALIVKLSFAGDNSFRKSTFDTIGPEEETCLRLILFPNHYRFPL